MSTLESFKIGETNISNPIIYYSRSNNYNLIGTEITKHFIVTLNFQEKELYLTPLDSITNEKKKSFGFDLNRNENTIYISKIYEGLSADKAGLILNDEVLSVNGEDLEDYSFCDFYYHVKTLLKGDKSITIKVKRNDEVKVFVIDKSDLINQ